MKIALHGFFLLLFAPLAHAGQLPTFATADGALRGYDPVAGFAFGEAIPGDDGYSPK